MFLLFFNKTRSPIPAPDISPDIIAPKVIVPLINIMTSPTDIAQLGISPRTAVIKGVINKLKIYEPWLSVLLKMFVI